MSEKLTLDKVSVARIQIETAIDLYFKGGHSVAIHTLAAAARSVCRDVCLARDLPPSLLDRFEPSMKDKKLFKFLVDDLRRPEGFFKHAKEDPNEVISYDPLRAEFIIVDTLLALQQLLPTTLVPHSNLFMIWFYMWTVPEELEFFGPLGVTPDQVALWRAAYPQHARAEFYAMLEPGLKPKA